MTILRFPWDCGLRSAYCYVVDKNKRSHYACIKRHSDTGKFCLVLEHQCKYNCKGLTQVLPYWELDEARAAADVLLSVEGFVPKDFTKEG